MTRNQMFKCMAHASPSRRGSAGSFAIKIWAESIGKMWWGGRGAHTTNPTSKYNNNKMKQRHECHPSAKARYYDTAGNNKKKSIAANSEKNAWQGQLSWQATSVLLSPFAIPFSVRLCFRSRALGIKRWWGLCRKNAKKYKYKIKRSGVG